MSLLGELVEIFAEDYRIGNIVYRRFPNDDIVAEESIKATHNEASI